MKLTKIISCALKIIVVGTVIFLVILAYRVHVYSQYFDTFQPVYQKEHVYTDSAGQKIYFKRKIWGLLGNHENKVLSTDSTIPFEPNDSTEFVYRYSSPIYYKVSNDSLILYLPKKAGVPPYFKSELVIIQKEIPNTERMDLFHNYKERGVSKF